MLTIDKYYKKIRLTYRSLHLVREYRYKHFIFDSIFSMYVLLHIFIHEIRYMKITAYHVIALYFLNKIAFK